MLLVPLPVAVAVRAQSKSVYLGLLFGAPKISSSLHFIFSVPSHLLNMDLKELLVLVLAVPLLLSVVQGDDDDEVNPECEAETSQLLKYMVSGSQGLCHYFLVVCHF